jgi:formylglycine-generating enzyme required for sulfatase activity
MVRIAGGTFTMGSSAEEIEAALRWCRAFSEVQCPHDQYERELPQRQVRLSSFYLDATEVTTERYAAWLDRQTVAQEGQKEGPPAGLHVKGRMVLREHTLLLDLYPSYGHGGLLYSAGRFAVRPGFERRPVTQVTWNGASRYCLDQGKRLPTEAEWEYAAGGARGHRFPWGDAEPRCEGVVFGRGSGLGCAGHGPGPEDVGTATQDRSPQGVFDLAGNVGEWVGDAFVSPYPPCVGTCQDPLVPDPPAGTTDPVLRVVRGGDWFGHAALCRAAGRGRLPQDKASGNIGFRCALSVTP